MNFCFFDWEIYKNKWFVVFKDKGQMPFVIDDQEKLQAFFKKGGRIFVGWNNYSYDNKVFAQLLGRKKLSAKAMWALNDKLINKNERVSSYKVDIVSLDASQEAGGQKINGHMIPPSLKKIEYGLGEDIEETPIPFDEPLDEFSLPLAIKYCMHDVAQTEKVFEQRRAYFEGKMDLIKEFNMASNPLAYMRMTRASLSAIALGADKDKVIKVTKEDFFYRKPKNLPQHILDYFDSLVNCIDERAGGTTNPEPYTFDYLGMEVTLAGGGIHGVVHNSQSYSDDEWVIVNIDVSSYYPNIIMNNNWFSRKCRKPEVLRAIYEGKERYKAEGNKRKSNIYKIVLNAYYGSLGGAFTALFDPVHRLNICVEGQVRLLELWTAIADRFEVRGVQCNTDGLMLKMKRSDKDAIEKIVHRFEEAYNYQFDFDEIQGIIQRDVNNYVEVQTDGSVKGKGFFASMLLKDGEVIDGMSKVSIKSTQKPNVVYKTAINNLLGTNLEVTPLDYFMLCAGTRVSVNYLSNNVKSKHRFKLETAKSARWRDSLEEAESKKPKSNLDVNMLYETKFYTDPPTEEQALQKFNRYYAAVYTLNSNTEQMILVNKKGEHKPKTPDNVRIMNKKVQGLPDDLDYEWYEKNIKNFELELVSFKMI